jgi:excisionase family DNA binding protein
MIRTVDEEFLTVAEIAALLRLNQQTVRNWIDQGSLPAVRVGRRVRVRQSDLNRLLDTGANGAESSDADGETDRTSGAQRETGQVVVARNRFAAALAETFRMAAAPASGDLRSTLRALAAAAENFAAALDPDSRPEAPGAQDIPPEAAVVQEPVTHRVTAKDIKAGWVRIPTATKELFPPARSEFKVRVRGMLLAAHWDPRLGPDRPVAGLLRFGRGGLERLIRENDVLKVAVDEGGMFELT